MLRFRARAAGATLAVGAAFALTLRGQAPDVRPTFYVSDAALPAIDEGVIWDDSRAPSSAAARAARAAMSQTNAAGESTRAYRPGRVIVRFRDGVPADDRRSIMRDATASGELMPRSQYADFDVIHIDPAENPEAVAAALNARSEVVYAQAAYRVHSTFKPNDPEYDRLQWNLPLINMERAWDIQPQAGSAVTVAVLDTGVAYRNATLTVNIRAFTDSFGIRRPALGITTIPYAAAPDLVGGNGATRIVAPFDATTGGANLPLDFEGHGTHVSGTIGQLTNDGVAVAGVAFNVKIMPVKVLASDWDVAFGNTFDVGGSDDDVAVGIRYATDNGAKVINMSLGSSGPPDCGTNANRFGCSPVIEAAMRYAVGKGVFIAIAGGNEFEDVVPPFGSNPTSVLAEIANRIDGVVAVAAVDPSRSRAYYSSTGNYIELAAPGGSNRGFGATTHSGYIWQQTFDFHLTDTFDPSIVPIAQYRAPRFDVLATIGYVGTSMATPHVAGIAAMLIQQGITDPAAIENALEQTADPLVPAGGDRCPAGSSARAPRTCSFGFGLVNARSALRGLGVSR
jgi:serine protease